MSTNSLDSPSVQLPKRRLYTGIGVYLTGQLVPLGIPLIVAAGLPDSLTATLSAFVFFGVPPIFTFCAIAILGKDGFNYLKSRAFAFVKRHANLGPVSRTRYHIGLVLFLIPLLLAWFTPYLAPLFPFLQKNAITVALVGDVLLLISLLVLGGEFWEKLRRLFIHRPEVDLHARNP